MWSFEYRCPGAQLGKIVSRLTGLFHPYTETGFRVHFEKSELVHDPGVEAIVTSEPTALIAFDNNNGVYSAVARPVTLSSV